MTAVQTLLSQAEQMAMCGCGTSTRCVRTCAYIQLRACSLPPMHAPRPPTLFMAQPHQSPLNLNSFFQVNDSEPEEDSHYLAITPVDEVKVCPGGRIRSMVWERRHWIILDGTGALWRVDLPQGGSLSKGAVVSRLLEFHAGGIVGLAASPVAHVAMTAGRDGSLRVFDCAARSLKATLMFNQPAMCFTTVGSDATLAVVGFKDGVIRAVLRLEDGLLLTAAYKPHKGAVTALAVAPDGTRLVTAGEDGTLFFFDIAGPHAITPLCFSQVGHYGLHVAYSKLSTLLIAHLVLRVELTKFWHTVRI